MRILKLAQILHEQNPSNNDLKKWGDLDSIEQDYFIKYAKNVNQAFGVETYIIGCTTNGRAIYYCKDNQAIGFPLAFLRDLGLEKNCEELVDHANRGANGAVAG